ncbi:MAG: hypothetical protein R3F61_38290 [Myxococcota bacterium]
MEAAHLAGFGTLTWGLWRLRPRSGQDGARFLGTIGPLWLASGCILALVWSEPSRTFGAIGRIQPLLAAFEGVRFLPLLIAILSAAALWVTGDPRHHGRIRAALEVGVVFLALEVGVRMLYSRPTLGTWWTWDASAPASLGVALLAARLPRRPRASALSTLGLAACLILLLYWLEAHRPRCQFQVSPEPVDPRTVAALTWGLAMLAVSLIATRWNLELRTAVADASRPSRTTDDTR